MYVDDMTVALLFPGSSDPVEGPVYLRALPQSHCRPLWSDMGSVDSHDGDTQLHELSSWRRHQNGKYFNIQVYLVFPRVISALELHPPFLPWMSREA